MYGYCLAHTPGNILELNLIFLGLLWFNSACYLRRLPYGSDGKGGKAARKTCAPVASKADGWSDSQSGSESVSESACLPIHLD